MITQERVKQVFKYVQGNLYWRINLGTRGKIGVKAGNLNKGGYYIVQIDKEQHYIHRLIYLYHHGYMPKFIDHKHGKRIGNYIWNLRPCTRSQNAANQKINSKNKSGYKNVFWQKSCSKWCGVFRREGEWYYCGYFINAKDADTAVRKKLKEIDCKFSNQRV